VLKCSGNKSVHGNIGFCKHGFLFYIDFDNMIELTGVYDIVSPILRRSGAVCTAMVYSEWLFAFVEFMDAGRDGSDGSIVSFHCSSIAQESTTPQV